MHDYEKVNALPVVIGKPLGVLTIVQLQTNKLFS